jgi:hypothetical protein
MLLIKRVFIKLSKHELSSWYHLRLYSSVKSSAREQNTFFFEKSPILSSELAKNSNAYSKLYDNLPVVLLFGWTGSRDRQLVKYQKLYSSMGYHVLRFSPSNKLTFLGRKDHPKYTENLLYLFTNELKLTKNPIITHIFSNAGSFIFYQHIIHQMNQQNKNWEFFKLNHRAAIYDSSPGWPHSALPLWHGIADLNRPLNFFARYLISTVLVSCAALYHYGQLGKNYFTVVFDRIINDKRPVPTLIMYSEADKLIDPKSIKEMIIKRKQLHKDLYLKTVVFKDADHVLIYKKYPDDYLKHITEHLKMCNLDQNTVLEKMSKMRN